MTKAATRKKPVKTNRSKTDKIVEDKSLVSTFGRGLSAPDEIPGFNVLKTLDQIEKTIGVGSMGIGGKNDTRMSTGLLMVDLVLGGGITAGWYTTFGKEQCCKSTLVNTIMVNAITQKVPIICMADYEGSTEPNYVQNILYTMRIKAEVSDVFGIRDRNGNFIKVPRVRYNPFDTAEQFFDYLAILERELPDKIFQGGQWWYVYENTNINRKKLAESKAEYDKRLFSKYNKFYVPAPDGTLQAIMIPDSYPAMLPERLDVTDPKAGLAAVARMFSEQLPRVKSKLRKKRIAVIGVNQLRDVPMAMYGPKEQQAAGNAVRFYSDVRLQNTSRALSVCKEAKAGKDNKGNPSSFEWENSVEFEGRDCYRYIEVKGEKNKRSQPYLKELVRLWIEDGQGNARGFDPVFDTYEYLKSTGQLSGNRKAMTINIDGETHKKPLSWSQFKTMILGEKDQIKSVCSSVGLRPVMLRTLCFKQMKTGKGVDLYFSHLQAKASAKAKKAENNEDEDDDGDENED